MIFSEGLAVCFNFIVIFMIAAKTYVNITSRVRLPICMPESTCVLYIYFNGEPTIRFRHTNRGSYPII